MLLAVAAPAGVISAAPMAGPERGCNCSVLLCTAHPAAPGPSPTLSLPSGMPFPPLLHLPNPASSRQPSAPSRLSFPMTASVSATLLCHSASAFPTALLCPATPGESPTWSSQRTRQNEARVRSKVRLEPKSPSSLLCCILLD